MTAARPATRSARASLGAITLTAGLLAGCTSADPAPLPQPPTPTPTASPAADSPTATAAASATTAPVPSPALSGVQGEIERAVLAYFAALNQAFSTGDTRAYATTFTSGCAACTTLKARLDADRAKGLRADGLRDEVSNLKVTVGTNNTGFASADVRVPAFRLLDRSGKTVNSSPETSSTLNLAVNRTPSGWKVIDVRNAAAS